MIEKEVIEEDEESTRARWKKEDELLEARIAAADSIDALLEIDCVDDWNSKLEGLLRRAFELGQRNA